MARKTNRRCSNRRFNRGRQHHPPGRRFSRPPVRQGKRSRLPAGSLEGPLSRPPLLQDAPSNRIPRHPSQRADAPIGGVRKSPGRPRLNRSQALALRPWSGLLPRVRGRLKQGLRTKNSSGDGDTSGLSRVVNEGPWLVGSYGHLSRDSAHTKREPVNRVLFFCAAMCGYGAMEKNESLGPCGVHDGPHERPDFGSILNNVGEQRLQD